MGEGHSTLEKFAVTLPPCSSALRYPKSEALDNHSVRDKQTFSDLPALALHAVRHRVQSPARVQPFNRAKVSDERADRVLSTKLRTTKLSCPQPCPELTFGVGLLAA